MTQSGQGDEQQLPAVRPAHEGVVLPSDGGEPWTPGGAADGRAVPAGGQPWGQPWGPQDGAGQDPYGGQGQQPPYDASGQQGQYGGQDGYGQGGYDHGQQPPAYGQGQQQPYAQPLPPEAGHGAAPGGDADATQYIAPIPAGPAPGGLPPENPAESTRFLGHGPQQGYQQPGAHAAPPAQGGPDADATQYIPPVPGGAPYGIRPGAPGERQPPAEFDNLFRSDAPEGATQQMPRFDPAQQHQAPQQPYQAGPPQQQPYQAGPPPQQSYQQPPQPPYSGPEDGLPQNGDGDGGRRKKSAAVPLIAAVVVGCAVIGLGAGALMSGGDDDDKDAKQPVASASSPAASEPAKEEPAPDPAKPQAEELDKLLADSNNSRAAVIGAVEKTKSCTELDKAVSDLKGAAQQRRDLVTRLEGLTLDKLPNHDRLTAALTKAWKASASADDHYAAWARQAKSKKVCKDGHARTTSHTQQATVKSEEASTAKRQAATLWNAIAAKYDLTKREATAL
ncbi:hypothetical protein P8A18_19645 [Streptomyces castrisilvae]|uniref:Uncharacterized protein n=1 Tax=Streptomyces castrisilvae TaxID=3033811 RepID=A0ABY9HLT2_9ACTN|nr:hypothetical protein [Streptomyces sp. Mut1]WLQ35498.1 hypothetical protein P8A18_19645 [Streptomyces sp. Mut1]